MVLKLYGHPESANSYIIAMVMKAKNVPFELHSVDYQSKEHKTAAYLEKQPFGQFPYLDDDGFILYETRAIARYIDEKYRDQGIKLTPTDLKAKALFEQAVSVEAFNFFPSALQAIHEKVGKPFVGQTPDKAIFDSAIETLSTKLDVYDKILSKQKYLAGDELTLADLFHLAYGAVLEKTGSDVMSDSARPNVKRWWNDLISQPLWTEVKKGLPVSN